MLWKRILCIFGIHKFEPRPWIKFKTTDGINHSIDELTCIRCGKPSSKEIDYKDIKNGSTRND